jgi:undecaprenyl-diphosphatase
MLGAPRLSLRHAFVLGLLQGPTELLPVSSSAHTTLLPWLAGWRYGELDPRLRKSFEVALHAGTAAALLLRAPWERPRRATGEEHAADAADASRSAAAQLGCMAAAVTLPALAGYTLGGHIERRLGTPATIAGGLLAGSVAILAGELRADRSRAALRTGTARVGQRDPQPPTEVNVRDGLALGIAQALALVPGVSRSGATIATARARGFSRRDADRLSWQVGLPVIAGAAALKGSRLAREGVPREFALPLAAGAGGAFFSALAAIRVIGPGPRATLLPVCAAYRAVLALLVVRRLRDNTSGHAHANPKK